MTLSQLKKTLNAEQVTCAENLAMAVRNAETGAEVAYHLAADAYNAGLSQKQCVPFIAKAGPGKGWKLSYATKLASHYWPVVSGKGGGPKKKTLKALAGTEYNRLRRKYNGKTNQFIKLLAEEAGYTVS